MQNMSYPMSDEIRLHGEARLDLIRSIYRELFNGETIEIFKGIEWVDCKQPAKAAKVTGPNFLIDFINLVCRLSFIWMSLVTTNWNLGALKTWPVKYSYAMEEATVDWAVTSIHNFREFSKEQIFMDIDTIPPGADLVRFLVISFWVHWCFFLWHYAGGPKKFSNS